LGELKTYSFNKIDESDTDELDFRIWYHLDLITDDGAIYKYMTETPRAGGFGRKNTFLPILNKDALELYLEKREGESIEEEIIGMDMNSKYLRRGVDF
jgi:hypothetical protein